MTGRHNRRGTAGRLTAATGAGWTYDVLKVRPIADRGLPEWLRPADGDTLFGIEAIARYLALPFLDVRTMLEMGRLPARKTGPSHAVRRSDLARHFLDLERALVPHAADVPEDIYPDDALGLLSGQHAIAAYMRCTHSAVRHRRATLGLSVFWIGKTPFARRASLDIWATNQIGHSEGTRRAQAIQDRRRAAAPPGALVGATEIAEFLGRTVKSVQLMIFREQFPVNRVLGGVVGDPDALAPFILPTRLDGQLIGIPEIASFLAVPEATAARMVAEGQIPAVRVGSRWTATREGLARDILAAERSACRSSGLAPAPVALVDDALGLLQGQEAIGHHIGRSRRSVEYLRHKAALPVFWIGGKPFARRASLDAWAAAQPGSSVQARRVATRLETCANRAPANAVIGSRAIGEALGITATGARRAIERGRLVAHRINGIWAADRRSIEKYRKERGHGQR